MKTNSLLTVQVQIEDDGLRLDKFLTSIEEISSRHYAQILIDQNRVTLDGRTYKASKPVKAGQSVVIDMPPLVPTELVPYDFPLDIVFEDSDLLVINKPSGLVVHPAAGHQQDTLVNALLHHTTELSMKHEQRPGIVHRIDKETSGLLVVAKNDYAHEHLSQQFKDKTTHRVYWAVVNGNVDLMQGTRRSYLARHPHDRKRHASVRNLNKIITQQEEDFAYGKWAVTHFKRLETSHDMSYLQLQLETGRTHQIRVHMSEMGHALVGDVTYGFPVKKAKDLLTTRFYLHAAELGFIHPRTEKEMLFKTGWPAVDAEFIKNLGFKNGTL